MALILSIDTATETAGVCLSNGGEVLASLTNSTQQEHASWVHTSIQRLMEMTGNPLSALQAVAVTEGPGSRRRPPRAGRR